MSTIYYALQTFLLLAIKKKFAKGRAKAWPRLIRNTYVRSVRLSYLFTYGSKFDFRFCCLQYAMRLRKVKFESIIIIF